MPHVREHLGDEAIAGWELEDVLAHVHLIERGLIRVDADEATYPLHVILRFEIEKDLIEGTLAPKDVPEAWDAKMQRVSWALDHRQSRRTARCRTCTGRRAPSATSRATRSGAMIAAQQWAALENGASRRRASDMRDGRFVGLNDWRRDNIWSQASRWSTPELLERATGEKLNARHFAAHLSQRYLA